METGIANLTRLLSQDKERDCEINEETFDLIYRGSSEIDRHYTKPMLPWIISEIKNQHKVIQVKIHIQDGSVKVVHKENKNVILEHVVKQIHKCVMEQTDHRCFLYTLRSLDKDPSSPEISSIPIPSNINFKQNYQCHLYQALTEQEVRSFFQCLRQQPREVKIPDSNSLNSLADLSVHTESLFFEVMFVGRVKVSHCKVPATFVDEALEAFKQKEKRRQRHGSTGEEAKLSSSPNRLMTFQHEGSGYSVPNIMFKNLSSDATRFSKLDTPIESKNEYGDYEKKSAPKVRFSLWESGEASEDSIESPKGYLSPQTSLTSSNSSFIAKMNLKEIQEVPTQASDSNLSSLPDEDSQCLSTQNSLQKSGESNLDSNYSLSSSNSSSGQLSSPDTLKVTPVVRTHSQAKTGNVGPRINANPIEHMRTRSGSTGSVNPISKYTTTRPSESDLKALGYDFNRTMLFHIGHREIQLINPEIKSVQLNKPFKDVASCCQGVQASDHFGFICRELSGSNMVFVGYIFRCDKDSVSEEIMQVLNRSFSAMHEEHERERKEHLMCDFCPLKWFSQLCADVEGLPAQKAHYVIMKKVTSLPEEEREIIITKYEGAETSEIAQKNNVLMMLLRTHFEYKQMNHSHPSKDCQQRSEFLLATNIESSLKKAKQSITTSFSQLLKKKESDSNDKENVHPTEAARVSPVSSSQLPESNKSFTSTIQKESSNDSEPEPATSSCVLEGVSDSPLKPYRYRSSTISGMSGDSMRKELIAAKKKNSPLVKNGKKITTVPIPITPNKKIDMFMRFGGSSSPKKDEPPTSQESSDELKPIVSFRQSILKKVASPAKGVSEQRTRKISTGYLGQKDHSVAHPLATRTRSELKVLWKKAVFQQIILIRIERENQRLRALQKEAALQRVRLNYEELDAPPDALQTWEMMLSRPQARIDSTIISAGIRQGVPKIVRGDVWNLLMVQFKLYYQKSCPKSSELNFEAPYERMIKELTSHQHAILIDIGRTFPTHPYFTQTLGPGQLALFNVLKAYSILDPEVGYCQGLSFVGGVLLLHLEEEVAYNVLKHLMFDRGCRKHYRLELDGLQVRMYQLSRLVHDRLHQLYEHLEEHEVTPQLYAAAWFLTIFASQFPLNFVVRVFDLLFLIGNEAIFSVAFTLLQTHERKLLTMDSFEQIMEYFKNTVPDVSIDQLAPFFDKVCDCSFQAELSAYEVEYNVLKEELFFTPQLDASMTKLKEANKNLKKQNLDLLEELHSCNLRQQSLESSNQSLHQSQHHLEVRVRWLEIERNNMRQLIDTLCRNTSSQVLSSVPGSLERYLPNRTSSPIFTDQSVKKKNNNSSAADSLDENNSRSSFTTGGISLTVPSHLSWKADPLLQRSSTDSPSHVICPPKTSSSNNSDSKQSSNSLLKPDWTVETRSSTLDPQEMRDFLRRAMEGSIDE